MIFARWALILVLATAPVLAQAPAVAPPKASIPDEAAWAHFEKWVAGLKPVPPGRPINTRDEYVKALQGEGVPAAEAIARAERVNFIRRGSVEREKVYWNGAFKLGGGPSSPLRLMEEAIRKVKPGKALDAGMGRGRNAIYLASVGWDVHGYDMAPDALTAAQEAARQAGVKIATTEAKHDDFDFGESRYDLIVCAYCYMEPNDAKWPGVFWKALKPGGLVVFQSSVSGNPSWTQLSDNWKQFHILRMEDQDPGYIDDDWAPSRTFRTVRLVVRKEQAR